MMNEIMKNDERLIQLIRPLLVEKFGSGGALEGHLKIFNRKVYFVSYFLKSF